MSAKLQNWAGNYSYSTENVLYPESVDEIVMLVRQYEKLRILGTRHSFNGIADSDHALVSLARCTPTVRVNHQHRQVTIGANMTYGELCPILHDAGYALHNMASLPHISVIGACMTATHGSGVSNQNLAAQVAALKLVTSSGELVSLSRANDGENFNGAVIGLGGLGVVVELTLDLLPAYEMSQHVYLNLPVESLEVHFDEMMSSAYSVSFFTDWRGNSVNQVWLKHRTGDSETFSQRPEFFGALPAVGQMHPIAELSGEGCTRQLGVPGPWHERLPHFRIDSTPSAGNELQSEYFVARHTAADAIRAVGQLRQEIAPYLLISEIRSIAADDFWMSPCYHQDSIGIHFTWKQDWASVQRVLPQIEAELEPFGARPHWGKLFTMAPARLQPLYEMLPRFRELIQRYDPQGKFRNAFLQAHLYGDAV